MGYLLLCLKILLVFLGGFPPITHVAHLSPIEVGCCEATTRVTIAGVSHLEENLVSPNIQRCNSGDLTFDHINIDLDTYKT